MSGENEDVPVVASKDKPHKGRISEWERVHLFGVEFVIGKFIDHPEFGGDMGHTSRVISIDDATGELETLNSRYTLVKNETIQ